MPRTLKNLLSLILLAPLGTALAQSHAMIINDDSAELRYHSDANELLRIQSQQQYSLTVAKHGEPRGIHFRADSELLKYKYQYNKYWTATPKLGVSFSDFLDKRFVALGAGGVMHRPGDLAFKSDVLVELMFGPADWDITKGWVASFKIQANYPLPDDVELNFGFRRIDMKVDNKRHASFETGPYLGLTKHF